MTAELFDFIGKIEKKGSVLGLSNMRLLMEKLGNVQNALPIIHIAGTNGKGSVGSYLQSLFCEAGYSVGRYVSPAVFDPYEVYTINGEAISESEYQELMDEVRRASLEMEEDELPTKFEAETALAYLWFFKHQPDIVLVECGMGGQTDATNVMDCPLASVITAISMDHTGFLGSTLEAIAGVKAGIIKEGCPVFSAPQEESVSKVLSAVAKEQGAKFVQVREEALSLLEENAGKMLFTYETFQSGIKYSIGLETSMAGHYQMENAALAIEVFLGTRGKLEYVMDGIAKAKWPGRFEVVKEQPLVILDGAHNEGAAIELAKTLESCFGGEKISMIIGVLKDKDHKTILSHLMPLAESIVFVTPKDNPRALDGGLLLEEARELSKDVKYSPDMDYEENYRKALQKAVIHDKPILVCGSLSYLGAMRKEIEQWN